MKKRVLIAIASVLLAALILLLLPVDKEEPPQVTVPTVPTTTIPPTTTTPAVPGQVRIYCCRAEWLPALEEMAAAYQALTGTEVTLLTAGDADCQTALASLMASETPPTVLCLHGPADLERWESSLLELQDTAIRENLYAEALGFWREGALLAFPMELEAMGLLFNAELMAVSLTRKDVTDFTTLTTAAQILKNNAIFAFSAIDLRNPACLYLLKNGDRDTIRAFADLYRTYRAGASNGMQQFLQREAVFYFGTSGIYSQLEQQTDSALEMRNLDILPTWTAGGMHYLCDTAWAVNGSVRQEDLTATMAFLTWMVTAGEEMTPVDSLQTLTPFTQATWYGNQLEKKLRGYLKNEASVLIWATQEDGDAQLLAAFGIYLSDPTDENWAAVSSQLPEALQQPE